MPNTNQTVQKRACFRVIARRRKEKNTRKSPAGKVNSALPVRQTTPKSHGKKDGRNARNQRPTEWSKDRKIPAFTAREKTEKDRRKKTDHLQDRRFSLRRSSSTLTVAPEPVRDGTHAVVPEVGSGDRTAQGMGFFEHTSPELDGGTLPRQAIGRIGQDPADATQ